MIQMFNDEQVLDEGFRKKILDEIKGNENVYRKQKMLNWHELYKDMIKKHVIAALEKELSRSTVAAMQNRAANVSIYKKVVNKCARSYSAGVTRSCDDENSADAIQAICKQESFDQVMQKVDRFKYAFKNTQIEVVPVRDDTESDIAGKDLYRICFRAAAPYTYDVIPDYLYPDQARCVILSPFSQRLDNQKGDGVVSQGYQQSAYRTNTSVQGDSREQLIANSPEDMGKECQHFIWWTGKYHFTTDDKGTVVPEVSPEDYLNPIGEIPRVNFAADQDGSFWAQGGDDLADSTVLINVLLTDMYGIANQQGWGQLVVTGKGIKKEQLTMGPHNAVLVNYEKDDPEPKVEYKTSNPPLDQHMRMIEQHIALTLTANNLSVKSIAGSLDAQNSASAIAMLVDQAESVDDVKNDQASYANKEPEIWRIYKKWFDLYFDRGLLVPDLMAIGKWDDVDVQLSFSEQKPVISETERLQNIKLLKEIGLLSDVEILQQLLPNLSDDDARKKILDLSKEKQKKMQDFAAAQPAPAQAVEEEEDNGLPAQDAV